MSLARIYTTKGPVRKDGLKCGKCGTPIVKGQDRRITFSVGYRGWEQTRCLKAECYPTRAERESSALASVYDTIDSADVSGAGTLDDLMNIRDDVVASLEEVADEYESNEMFDVNPDLEERADMLRTAASELEDWEPQEEEPQEDDERDEDQTYEEALAEWLEEARESLQDALNNLELP